MTRTLNPSTFAKASQKPAPEFIHLIEKKGTQAGVRFENLTIRVPRDKRVLIENASLDIKAGDRIGFTGPNGSGKSSLFRAVRGLDSDGIGKITITLPAERQVFCASQEIRKAPVTLPGLLAYPHDPGNYTKLQYEEVLREAGLEQILVHLPWNAVHPENILKILNPILERDLEALEGTLSETAVRNFAEAFCDTLRDSLTMPDPLRHYYTDDIHRQVIEGLKQTLAEKLKYAPHKKQTLMLFPKSAARKMAKSVAENAKASIDGWLLQGHRMRLSGGEQQKMVFARMFLQGPENAIFLLDEVTSALKESTAHELYGKLIDKYPGATFIGIIHDTSLLKHFTHHLELGTDRRLSIKKLASAAAEITNPEIEPQIL